MGVFLFPISYAAHRHPAQIWRHDMSLVQPTANVDPDAFPRSTLCLGQVLMTLGGLGLAAVLASRMPFPHDGARNIVQIAAFVLSAWPLLLGSTMTEMAGIPGRSRAIARALLAFACCYLLARFIVAAMH